MRNDHIALRPRNILVAVDFASTSDRDFFSGILRFSRDRPDWRISVLQSSNALTAAEIRRAERNETHGIITCRLGKASARQQLIRSKLPIVLVGHHETLLSQRTAPSVSVTVDNVAIGKLGAEFLSSLGNFAAYAYLPSDTTDFARMDRSREVGFKRYLRKHHKPLLAFSGGKSDFGKLIRKAPKPLALLCSTDACAVHALKVCETRGISVPKSVVVLGIDNDELLCRTTNPELSSIAINPENEGFVAAEQMDRLLRGWIPEKMKNARIAPVELHVVERTSTKAISPAQHLIDLAGQFIASNANKPIKVDDVAGHLRVSRRLIELRFRQFKNMSIHDEITRVRLNAFARKLQESEASVKAISANCGFRNISYAKTMFRKQFGLTPSEYRNIRRRTASEGQPPGVSKAQKQSHAATNPPSSTQPNRPRPQGEGKSKSEK